MVDEFSRSFPFVFIPSYHWHANTEILFYPSLGSLARTMCSQLHGFAGARQNKNDPNLPSNCVLLEAMLMVATCRF